MTSGDVAWKDCAAVIGDCSMSASGWNRAARSRKSTSKSLPAELAI